MNVIAILLMALLSSAAPNGAQTPLEEALAREDAAAIRRLVSQGDAAFGELKQFRDSKDARVRKTLAFIAGQIGTQAADAFLLSFLDDSNDKVVAEAVESLLYVRRPKEFGIHGEPVGDRPVPEIVKLGKRAIPGLELALNDIYPVRVLAAKTFGMFHSKIVIEPLLRNFDKLKHQALFAGAMALAEFNDKRIPPVLISRLGEGLLGDFSNNWTGFALEQMGDRALPYLADGMRRYLSTETAFYLIITAHNIGGKKAEEIIEFASSSKARVVRATAAQYLRYYETPDSIKTLKRLALDKNEDVRKAAKESLQKLAARKARSRNGFGLLPLTPSLASAPWLYLYRGSVRCRLNEWH